MRWNKRSLLLCLVALILPVPMFPARSFADSRRVSDQPAHDSGSDFDIEWVKHGHDGRKLVHVISTYDGWKTSELGENLFQINISPGDGSPSVRRILLIWLEGSRLKAKMMDVSNGSEVLGHPAVGRPTGRSVKVTFPKRFIRRGLDAYRWQALVADQQVDDWVPSENGFILHEM